MEWHAGGWDIEVEFGQNGEAVFWGEDASGATISGQLGSHDELTKALIRLSQTRELERRNLERP